jgi:hypothetical protein
MMTGNPRGAYRLTLSSRTAPKRKAYDEFPQQNRNNLPYPRNHCRVNSSTRSTSLGVL